MTTALLPAILLALAVSGAAPADTGESWKAVAASGPVDHRPSGAEVESWSPVRRGDRVAPLAELRTGARGRATLVLERNVLVVDPQSRLVLPAIEGEADSVLQESGSVVYDVRTQPGRPFRVETPWLVAGVKGTVFLVSVGERGASVTVERGSVEVLRRTSGERFEIGAGETIFVPRREAEELARVDESSARERSATRAVRRATWENERRLVLATDERRFARLDPAFEAAPAARVEPDAVEKTASREGDAVAVAAKRDEGALQAIVEEVGEVVQSTDEATIDDAVDETRRAIDDALPADGSTTGGTNGTSPP